MGVKKLVTITVEAQIEIELPDELQQLSEEDIKGINACGYDIQNVDDLYKHAAELVLNGGENGNWDVFGWVISEWKKGMTGIPTEGTFFNRCDLHIEDCKVEDI